MAKTYVNNIVTKETSIAIEQLIIAPEGTAWTPPAQIDVDSPPTGFTTLGAVDEEASVISITRTKLELRTGIPQVLQFDAVTALEGKISTVLLSNSNAKAVFAMGAADVINVSPNAVLAITSTTANPSSQSIIVWDAAAPTGSGVPKVGDEIVASTTQALWAQSTNVATVASLDATTPSKIFHMFPIFASTPAPGAAGTGFAAKRMGTRLAFGTSVLKRYRLIGVADFLDGSQLVHDFPKVSAFGEWVEEVRASQTGRIPISFDAFGTTSTDFNHDSTGTTTSELIVGSRYIFNKVL